MGRRQPARSPKPGRTQPLQQSPTRSARWVAMVGAFNEDLSIGKQRYTTMRHNINAFCFRRDSVIRSLVYHPRIP